MRKLKIVEFKTYGEYKKMSEKAEKDADLIFVMGRCIKNKYGPSKYY